MYVVSQLPGSTTFSATSRFESKHDAEQAFRLREKVINDDLLSDDEYLDLYRSMG
jgi:hypothetical protein